MSPQVKEKDLRYIDTFDPLNSFEDFNTHNPYHMLDVLGYGKFINCALPNEMNLYCVLDSAKCLSYSFLDMLYILYFIEFNLLISAIVLTLFIFLVLVTFTYSVHKVRYEYTFTFKSLPFLFKDMALRCYCKGFVLYNSKSIYFYPLIQLNRVNKLWLPVIKKTSYVAHFFSTQNKRK